MDIGTGHGYPASALSNLPPHPFVFDGVECASMEGLLQAFKFDKEHIQVVVCQLVGLPAKYRGKKRNKQWKRTQTLWWKGRVYERGGKEYQLLLDRAFEALAKNQGFRNALIASGDAVFTHSIGKTRIQDTVLTVQEFCSRLTRLRDRINRREL